MINALSGFKSESVDQDDFKRDIHPSPGSDIEEEFEEVKLASPKPIGKKNFFSLTKTDGKVQKQRKCKLL